MSIGKNIKIQGVVFFLTFFSTVAGAQIHGAVVDAETKDPLSGVYVAGYSESKLVCYAFSEKDGSFILYSPVVLDNISASVLGYEGTNIAKADFSENIKLELCRKSLSLKPSKVVHSIVKTQGDTIRYEAAAFRTGLERNAGDLLEKLPGVSISKSGGILHNGRYISKLYVEGLDMLGNRYGVITKNLNPSDIDKVEIYQNHQPVQVLKNIRPEESSGINIILKEEVKNSWILSGEAFTGAPKFPVYDLDAILSNFGKQTQSLFIAKGNNTGDDIERELHEQRYYGKTGAFKVDSAIEEDFFTVLYPERMSLSIPEEYWFDNNSGIASLSHLSRAGKDGYLSFRLNASVLNEIEKQLRAEELHFPGAGVVVIEEQRSTADRSDYISGEVSYITNSSSKYIDNELSFSGQFRERTDAIGGFDRQKYFLPSIRLSDSFNAVFRIKDNKAITLSSETKYSVNGHSASFLIDGAEYTQDYFRRWFSSSNRLSASAGLINNHIFISAGADIDNIIINDAFSVTRIKPDITLSDTFYLGNLAVSAKVPVYLNIIKERICGAVWFLETSPEITIKYPVSQEFEVLARGKYNYCGSSPESLYSGKIMTDYRNVQIRDSLAMTNTVSSSLTLRYSNIPSMFFTSLSVVWSGRHQNRMPVAEYKDNVTVSDYLVSPSGSSTFFVGGNVSKYVGVKVLRIDLNVTAADTQSLQMLQGIKASLNDRSAGASLSLSLCPSSWISAVMEGSYSHNWLSGAFEGETGILTADGRIKLKPLDNFSLDTGLYYQMDRGPESTVSNLPLMKIALKWMLPRVELTAECRNALGAKEFRREWATGYQSFVTVTDLRERCFLVGVRFNLNSGHKQNGSD